MWLIARSCFARARTRGLHTKASAMASYMVAAGQRGVHRKTATANVVDTVTFTDNVEQVEIINDGSAALYVTVDGQPPTVAGPHTDELPAGGPSSRTIAAPAFTGAMVLLVSDGAPAYSVARLS